jgi:hypothetical protein
MLRLIRNDVSLVIGGTIDPEPGGTHQWDLKQSSVIVMTPSESEEEGGRRSVRKRKKDLTEQRTRRTEFSIRIPELLFFITDKERSRGNT